MRAAQAGIGTGARRKGNKRLRKGVDESLVDCPTPIEKLSCICYNEAIKGQGENLYDYAL